MAAQGGDEPAGAPGQLVDDRYRLDQVRAEHRPNPDVHVVLWRAADTALERPVAIVLVTGLNQRSHKAVAAAAARASQVTDVRFVRVLDVGRLQSPSSGRTTGPTWIATEWVDAPSLAATTDEWSSGMSRCGSRKNAATGPAARAGRSQSFDWGRLTRARAATPSAINE